MTEEGGVPEASVPRRARRGYWVPGVIALVAMLAIAIPFGAGDLVHSSPKTLHGSDVASEIALAIQAGQRLSSPPDVMCPPSEPVRAQWTFECQLIRGSTRTTLTVTEIDGRGHLRWQEPLNAG